MRNKRILFSLAGLALAAFTANACLVEGVISCPNDTTAAGIRVYIVGGDSTVTDAQGVYLLGVSHPGDYTVCVDPTSLPAGLMLKSKPCANFTADALDIAVVNFTLEGPACEVTPPQGPCWLTGGGTIGRTKGVPDYSYGGVVNPGCSPIAAGGGNWNVLSHLDGLHFQGQLIHVIGCSGVQDKAPKVNVNIIDFEGTGILTGVDGNPMMQTAVTFFARAEDHGEPGAGKDALWLKVVETAHPNHVLLLISDSSNPAVVAPVQVSTGNLQIHTSSCD